MIAIILPTRGLVFTKVEEAIERERSQTWIDIKVFRSYDLPIPEAQNFLVQQALNEKNTITHLWFVEEDTVPPLDCLKTLTNVSEDIAFIDYGVNGWSCSTRKETGEIMWCGFGCTMVKRNVFEKMERPWFRTDKSLRLNDMSWIDTNPHKVYGQQDIWFCMQAKKNGAKIVQVKGECEHLGLKALGKVEVNKGIHTIEPKSRIEKQNIINFSNEEGVDSYGFI